MPTHRKNGVSMPLWVSQNYLTSNAVINRALNKTSLCQADHVIEIGSGKGHITRELAKRCGFVTAIELDAQLCSKLREKLGTVGNVKLYQGDFLRWKLPSNGNYKVFSNIPFSITSDIIHRLTMCPNPPTDAWLVMEKGAAKRFMGLSRESVKSLLLKPFFDIRPVYHFRRDDFHPMPNVDIVLTHFSRKHEPDIPFSMRWDYSRFIESGMKQGIHALLTKRQITTALRLAGLSNDKPSGEMLYVQWLCLFRSYAGLMSGKKI